MTSLKSKYILQFPEIETELNKSKINLAVLILLISEMLGDLRKRVAAIYCVEICKVFWELTSDFNFFDNLPSDVYDFIRVGTTLYLYPSNLCETTPYKLHLQSQKLMKKYPCDNYITKKERIIKMYNNNEDIEIIANQNTVDESLVIKTLILEGKIIKKEGKIIWLEKHNVWPF